MKKFFFNFFLLLISLLALTIIILSTTGIETDRFNNFIYKKVSANKYQINLDLNKIKFKLDVKKFEFIFWKRKKQKSHIEK